MAEQGEDPLSAPRDGWLLRVNLHCPVRYRFATTLATDDHRAADATQSPGHMLDPLAATFDVGRDPLQIGVGKHMDIHKQLLCLLHLSPGG